MVSSSLRRLVRCSSRVWSSPAASRTARLQQPDHRIAERADPCGIDEHREHEPGDYTSAAAFASRRRSGIDPGLIDTEPAYSPGADCQPAAPRFFEAMLRSNGHTDLRRCVCDHQGGRLSSKRIGNAVRWEQSR